MHVFDFFYKGPSSRTKPKVYVGKNCSCLCSPLSHQCLEQCLTYRKILNLVVEKLGLVLGSTQTSFYDAIKSYDLVYLLSNDNAV